MTKPLNRITKNMISEFQFLCSNDGCDMKSSYSDAKNHAKNCNKNPIPCT